MIACLISIKPSYHFEAISKANVRQTKGLTQSPFVQITCIENVVLI